jgi:hypothetical protein
LISKKQAETGFSQKGCTNCGNYQHFYKKYYLDFSSFVTLTLSGAKGYGGVIYTIIFVIVHPDQGSIQR